ncbi:hypothetical protein [Kibdelosporangium phytohabitans]|uniref:Peptidase S33 tripeptidyl aminopeptidase-like C-terminal domain-containing protein n=1 Tax=Kibdelosporangium phytohabitans TaxID=860235 RepID=A0A0N9I2S8_9PSEU|nr:hypothetical protein [Kibdelosporangium phytohabitans]ALG12056.1 hypothetical protein AOZ06_38940 [Kibdelosporangium phytohabitans]MBE1463538.1 hypothetical protein [Kibdelosporangium phytohabitans]
MWFSPTTWRISVPHAPRPVGSEELECASEGDHGICSNGNAAVLKIVNAYLVDGVVPRDQNVPGVPLP